MHQRGIFVSEFSVGVPNVACSVTLSPVGVQLRMRCLVLLILWVTACGSNQVSSELGTSGGRVGAVAAAASGGAPSTGGLKSAGGATVGTTRGTIATGGTSATGGAPSTGGVTNTKLVVKLISAGSCLLYTSPSPRDRTRSRMPSSA